MPKRVKKEMKERKEEKAEKQEKVKILPSTDKQVQPQETSVSGLPPEIWIGTERSNEPCIADYLDIDSLCSLSQTCRFFQASLNSRLFDSAYLSSVDDGGDYASWKKTHCNPQENYRKIIKLSKGLGLIQAPTPDKDRNFSFGKDFKNMLLKDLTDLFHSNLLSDNDSCKLIDTTIDRDIENINSVNLRYNMKIEMEDYLYRPRAYIKETYAHDRTELIFAKLAHMIMVMGVFDYYFQHVVKSTKVSLIPHNCEKVNKQQRKRDKVLSVSKFKLDKKCYPAYTAFFLHSLTDLDTRNETQLYYNDMLEKTRQEMMDPDSSVYYRTVFSSENTFLFNAFPTFLALFDGDVLAYIDNLQQEQEEENLSSVVLSSSGRLSSSG